MLIQTDIAEPAPIYSVNVFGERSAASTSIVPRPAPVDVKQLLGDYVNNQTAFNMAGIYANGTVSYTNSATSEKSWQQAIDDDPESLVSVNASTAESGMVVRFDGAHPFTRLSLLTNSKTRGKVDIFLLSEAPQQTTPVSLEGVNPSVTLTFDGTSQRAFADFAETRATALALRWTPESGDAPLALREINIFGDISLTTHEVTGAPIAVAQGPNGDSEGTSLADGKSMADGKAPIAQGPKDRNLDFKGTSAPPIAAGPGRGFDPGAIGFPPLLGIPRQGLTPPQTPTPISD